MKAITRDELAPLFSTIDLALGARYKKTRVIILGGLAIIAQNFRDRATKDIDIALTPDAAVFEETCRGIGIPVDIVTIASTVDFNHITTERIFSGENLIADAVTAPDLIRLKLERFQKHEALMHAQLNKGFLK